MMRLCATACLALLLALVCDGHQVRGNGPQTFDIDGRLINALNGDTVRGGRVGLAPTTQRMAVQVTEAARDGSFSFHHLAPGKYTLIGWARGFPQQNFEQHGMYDSAIVVGPDKISTGLLFRLRPEASISGRVFDEHNEPARNAQVILFEDRLDTGHRHIASQARAQTDDTGEYHFGHLFPGTYFIALTAQPWFHQFVSASVRDGSRSPPDPALDITYPVTYYPNVTDADSAGTIALRPGDHITADFALTPVAALHVLVHNANSGSVGKTQPTFLQQIFDESKPFARLRYEIINSDTLEISGLAPGSYSVQFQSRGTAASAGVQQLNLRDNSEIDALQSSTSEPIEGHVTFEAGPPPSQSLVRLQDLTSGRGRPVPVSEEGDFKITDIGPGRYSVNLLNSPGFVVRAISATGARVQGHTVEISGTQAVQLSLTASRGVATIEGTALKNGKSLMAAMVVLVPANPADNYSLFRRDQSDSDGTFTLREVVPGYYTLLAIENGWEIPWADPNALRPYLNNGTPIQVQGTGEYKVEVTAQ